MKHSRKNTKSKTHAVPDVRFAPQQSLTAFGGLVILQTFFAKIGFKEALDRCFRHTRAGKVFPRSICFLQLVLHHILGYRELRDSAYYRDDPMVKQVLALKHLPDPSTLSRMLAEADEKSVKHLHRLLSALVLDRLVSLGLSRVTLDFDGSVQSTTRRAEGAAVGYNKIKKGARSYYPLFCTVSQTGQALDFLHRSGNVHDSRGAREFIAECIAMVRQALPGVIVEVRADSAFFSDELVSMLREQRVEFTVSVPFERFAELKGMIESQRTWRRINADLWYFENRWHPKSWPSDHRFLFIRQRVRLQRKGPVQLDLFVPYEEGFEFKVIITNKSVGAETALRFHEGRGAQEGVFGELKTHCHMGHVPVRRRCGNEMYLLACLFAHNLMRELQMQTAPPSRKTTGNRAALWVFERVDTLRRNLFQRVGRLTRPGGKLTLTLSANPTVRERLLDILHRLGSAA